VVKPQVQTPELQKEKTNKQTKNPLGAMGSNLPSYML
jgi:hypothetical protein